MSKPQIPSSEAELAARLVVEGVLRMIRGDVQGQVGVEPVVMSPEERTKLGLIRGGPTLFYPAGEGGVFFDMMGDQWNVWFSGPDSAHGTKTLHDMLMRNFPNAKQLDDVPFVEDPRMHARVYAVEIGSDKRATIETACVGKKGGKFTFSIRVIAQQRVS